MTKSNQYRYWLTTASGTPVSGILESYAAAKKEQEIQRIYNCLHTLINSKPVEDDGHRAAEIATGVE